MYTWNIAYTYADGPMGDTKIVTNDIDIVAANFNAAMLGAMQHFADWFPPTVIVVDIAIVRGPAITEGRLQAAIGRTF